MAWELLGSGNVLGAGEIANYVSQVPDNTRVKVAFNLRASPAGWMIDQLQNTLENQGVPGVKVSTGSPIINISWVHNPAVSSRVSSIALAPLTAVAIILAALAVIAVVIIGWLVYKDVPAAFKPAVVIGVIALASLLVYSLIRQQSEG